LEHLFADDVKVRATSYNDSRRK